MELFIIILLIVSSIALAGIQIVTTKISANSQRVHTVTVYKLYKELKRFNDESDAMFSDDSDDTKSMRINKLDDFDKRFKVYETFGYAHFVTVNINLYLSENIDDTIGIKLVPKNDFIPVLIPQFQEYEVEWCEIENLKGEKEYYTSVEQNIGKDFCRELIVANQ